MYKIDLHTHSIVSPDGGLTKEDYEHVLGKGLLDVIAITDHNDISFAQSMQKLFGDKIIVGEEISTTGGEIIGLFLKKKIAPHQSVEATIAAIHEQGGIVSIPHPFDMLRKGIGEKIFLQHLGTIDSIEGFNARTILPLHNTKAMRFGKLHQLSIGVGSDAHTVHGIGFSYAMIGNIPTAKTLVSLLQNAKYTLKYQPFFAFFAPKLNRFKKLYETK